ncbi:5031_t:CDS:2 [Rhizophagus irregularis]|nr:5031_t:CDS:2 [Rhizophagus irregularis]
MKVVVCSVISSSYLAACSPPLPGHKEYPTPSPHPCAVLANRDYHSPELKVTSTETEKSADVTEHIALMVSPIADRRLTYPFCHLSRSMPVMPQLPQSGSWKPISEHIALIF